MIARPSQRLRAAYRKHHPAGGGIVPPPDVISLNIMTSHFSRAAIALALASQFAIAAAVYRTEQGYVDANGVLIWYESFGQGKPLLIVHGGPGASHDYFLPYLAPLAREHRLIFIDER